MESYDTLVTPLGTLTLSANDTALTRVLFPHESREKSAIRNKNHPLLIKAKKELSEYLKGKRKKFTIPLSPRGTPFQMRTWKVLQGIHYGETLSYSEEARRGGHPRAVRAIGSANGKNPLPIFIPCHRVVPKGGGLGGYSGGIRRKKKLLMLEEKYH